MSAVRRAAQPGFTLLELMVALSIAAVLMAVSAPAAQKMYQSMQYRSAVGEIRNVLEAARYQALMGGAYVDVLVRPNERLVAIDGGKRAAIAESIRLDVNSALELQRADNTAVIRFYPDGTSTGGRVSVSRGDSHQVGLQVGWLMGEVSQYEPENGGVL